MIPSANSLSSGLQHAEISSGSLPTPTQKMKEIGNIARAFLTLLS